MLIRSILLPLLVTTVAFAADAPLLHNPLRAGPRHVVTVPPGFVDPFGVASRRVLCLPGEEKWITEVLPTPPVTQPSTRPADLLTKLKSSRAELADRMASEW